MLVVSFISCVSTNEDETKNYALGVGEKLPIFTVQMYDSSGFTGNVSTADLYGHKSIIVLFNTNCKDCQQELPILQQLYESIDTSSVRMVLISRAEKKDDILAYWNANNINLPFSPQEDTSIYSLFASSIIPRTYICNDKGIVVSAFNDNPLPLLSDLQSALK